jgi:glycosyltransferase involved in cell wall biosynthesis
MKVLLVNKFFYLKGGSEKYMFTLADALESVGHQVVFFAMQDPRNLPCKQSKHFVKNCSTDGTVNSKIRMLSHIAYSTEAYKKMTSLLNEEKPDLVILNLVHKQITCSIIDAIKNFKKDLPIVWTMHDLICVCPAYTMLDGKGNICEKCSDGNFDHCIRNKCVHNSILMSILSAYEAKQIKKHNWYNDISLYVCPSEFYKKKLEQSHFTNSPIICMRNPLPINQIYETSNYDGGYILYFGRLVKEKGVKLLIDTIKKTPYKLMILGTGPEEEELKQYVQMNKISNIEFEGFKQNEELLNFVKNSRAVVLPSQWYENGPYSAMEAMAAGKPLIVSNYGGLPELVDNNVNGFIFGSQGQLLESIQKIMTLPQNSYSSFCQKSMEKAKLMFSPTEYVKKLLYNICNID